MDYKVTDLQVGMYTCDTIFIEIDNQIIQIPVDKGANIKPDIIGKSVTIDDLYKVPLDSVLVIDEK